MVSLGRCVPIQRISAPSVADFYRFFVRPMLPVVIERVASDWPAISRWADYSYLHSTAGDASVEVEVGQNFLDPHLMQQRITLSDFIRQHLHVSCGGVNAVQLPQSRCAYTLILI